MSEPNLGSDSEMLAWDETGGETYLTFTLDGDVFAFNVRHVREVLEFTSVTRIPRAPLYLRGVLNLRGAVVPVVDMRLKLGMAASAPTVDTCIIVVELSGQDGAVMVGAVVDAVADVLEMQPSAIEPAPKFGNLVDAEMIQGMGRRDDELIIILDAGRVFAGDAQALGEHREPVGPLGSSTSHIVA